MVVAVTGASGFVGKHVLNYLKNKAVKVKRIGRAETGDLAGTLKLDWLEGVDTIVHAAAVAHSGHKLSDAEAARITRINADVPVLLAGKATERGVKRFIFISSAHVYGRSAEGALDEDTDTLPTNIYGASKMDAENRLVTLAEKTGLELIILRPPLIYGPEVKANFLTLLKLVNRGLPLPFSTLTEPRSYCYIGNLADAICHHIRSGQGWNDMFNVADAQPLGLSELCSRMAESLGRPSRIFWVPKWMIRGLLEGMGRRHMIEALCKPLVLDTRAIQQIAQWQPPFTTEEGLKATANWLKEKQA